MTATLDDVVQELGLVASQLELVKRLMVKFMIYHGVRQADVAKTLGTQQGHISTMVGGSGTRRIELKKGDAKE